MTAPRVIVVGHVDVDRVRTEAGVRERLLGGSALYTALSAAIHAPPAGLVGTICRDYPTERFEAAAAGRLRPDLVEVLGTTRRNDIDYTVDREGPSDRVSAGHTSDTWQEKARLNAPRHVPTTAGEATEVVHLSAMLPRYGRLYADWADERGFALSVDTSTYYAERFPDEMRDLVVRADLVLLSDTEATLLFPDFPADPRGHVKRILELGPEVVVVRRGEDGCLTGHRGSVYAFDAIETDVVDPTGAGDSFNGAFAARYHGVGAVKASALGIATATRCVEAFGNEALLETSREEVERAAGAVTDE
jgi:sugar/nucleoside kinase (ribokinase family)